MRRRQEADQQRRRDKQESWEQYERIRESTTPKQAAANATNDQQFSLVQRFLGEAFLTED